MIQWIAAQNCFIPFSRHRLSRNLSSQTLPCVSALALSALAGAWALDQLPVAVPEAAKAPAVASTRALGPKAFGALLGDLRSHSAPISLARSAPPERGLDSVSSAPQAAIPQPADAAPTPSPIVSELEQGAPLPPRRPSELSSSTNRGGPLQAVARQQQNGKTALPSASSDDRSALEKFFGVPQASDPPASKPALAYASQESGVFDAMRRITSGPQLGYDRQTAVYDISAHTVYLPDGTKLEAHSGLGDKLDNPRYVHVRMRGPTPPHVYDLSPRERLFHGVQALRLNPVGEGHVFGRAGLLAHTYMLGPNGASNGCVSFKNYGAFLRAFQNGEVKRLAVVAHID
jgi:hypothetical protein